MIKNEAIITVQYENATSGTWILLASWSEPEFGVSVHGPYATLAEAKEATQDPAILETYAIPEDDGSDPDALWVTEDVSFTITPIATQVWF